MDVPHTDPTGPVFVCYREDDGLPLAAAVAGVLRSVGVPIWFAPDDMGAGRFDRTFRDAAAGGLSGTVLVATANVAVSSFVQGVEAPVWKALMEDPDFVFAAVNTATTTDGTTDFGFPDRLVPQPGQRIVDYKQYLPSELDHLAADLAARRVGLLSSHGPPDALSVEITTRDVPHARPSDWQLRATITPPSGGATVLGPAQVDPVRRLTRELPRLAARAGTRTVRVRGGMHLPVAVAVGLALPVTRGVRVVVHDAAGNEWDSTARDGTAALFSPSPTMRRAATVPASRSSSTWCPGANQRRRSTPSSPNSTCPPTSSVRRPATGSAPTTERRPRCGRASSSRRQQAGTTPPSSTFACAPRRP